MNDKQSVSGERNNNPWRIGVIATVGAVLLLVAGVFTFAAYNNSQPSNVQQDVVSQAAAPARAVAAAPQSQAAAPVVAAQPREDCSQYRYTSQRDNTSIVKDGAIGAVIGAGTGAAGGAIADGGKGAKKGAGIGAVVGAVAGGAYGVTQENKRASDAEDAYQNCLARNN